MNIRPIKTEQDYESALAEIDRLFGSQPGSPQADRLEVLVTLVSAYENIHFPLPVPDPVEAILYTMESRGLTRKDLEPYLGSRARVAEILNHKRTLTLRMIQRLHAGLGIPAEALIQPVPYEPGNARKLKTGTVYTQASGVHRVADNKD
jgi:HTH-type transcriptional regulator / antitoxin HigA